MEENKMNNEIRPPRDMSECADISIGDELLSRARIMAYMYDQVVKDDDGEEKPYNPKTFPEKAIDITIQLSKDCIIEIFLETNSRSWNSKFLYDGRLAKLSPDQMRDFFASGFYSKMLASLEQKWPGSDPQFREMLDAVRAKQMKVGYQDEDFGDVSEYEVTEGEKSFGKKVNQPGKRKDLANKDVTGDGKRDYSSTGRKIIQHFGDQGVKGNSGMYYCWPNPKYPFKWSQWKDWTKIKPLCKMNFIYNGRRYGVSLSLYDENFQNRGFRAFDCNWRPPLGWLTPGEADDLMQLNIVQKFTRQCIKNIKKYIRMSAEDIYEKINNKDKISLEEIRKTIRVIRHVVDTALRKHAADTYCFEDEYE